MQHWKKQYILKMLGRGSVIKLHLLTDAFKDAS